MAMAVNEAMARRGGGDLPRAVVGGALGLALFSLLAAGAGRLSDVGTVHMPAARAVEALSLRFYDEPDGGVAVRDARDGALVYTVAPGTNGFIRGALRGLVRERKLSGVGDATPFTLTRWSDGRMSMADAATGRNIDLDAFGPTNAQAFAQMFGKGGAAR